MFNIHAFNLTFRGELYRPFRFGIERPKIAKGSWLRGIDDDDISIVNYINWSFGPFAGWIERIRKYDPDKMKQLKVENDPYATWMGVHRI